MHNFYNVVYNGNVMSFKKNKHFKINIYIFVYKRFYFI